jgi:hypothetical protein
MSKKTPVPIMSVDEERFMAFEGLVQWTQGVIAQGERLTRVKLTLAPFEKRRATFYKRQCQAHYFAIAAWKLLEHRKWVTQLGLCANVDFSEIDGFSETDIRDLRDMREHVLDYFKGIGRNKARWVKQTPEFKVDASTITGTKIGGRLDWKKFGNAARRLRAQLLKEPIPYPPR